MLVDGKSVLLLSGSVHCVRSTPEMWLGIFAEMKASGLNAVESYACWNSHVQCLEDRDRPDYAGRGNVTLLLQLAKEHNLFVIWRIGPYICAEWPGGGENKGARECLRELSKGGAPGRFSRFADGRSGLSGAVWSFPVIAVGLATPHSLYFSKRIV